MTTATPTLDAEIEEIKRMLFATTPENKAGFVRDLNRALIVNGGGRYDYLLETPLVYMPTTNESGEVIDEHVACGPHLANVTGDSLIGMIGDIYTQLFD